MIWNKDITVTVTVPAAYAVVEAAAGSIKTGRFCGIVGRLKRNRYCFGGIGFVVVVIRGGITGAIIWRVEIAAVSQWWWLILLI